jgi:murein DD-endopeptidase MepM/ murein hydrolase activator NlpD
MRLLTSFLIVLSAGLAGSAAQAPVRQPLHRTVELNVGEAADVMLGTGSKATVRLVRAEETRDRFRSAVREARVTVEVNGARADLVCATYRLPVTVGSVQVDCPATNALKGNARSDAWGLDKRARFRIWPAGSPWIEPDRFRYPARQKWFASGTQMANEPTFVDGGEVPGTKNIYYHNGLDIGGAEGLVDVIAATDGLVVSSGEERLAGHEGTPVAPRYDVVYLLDERGWYYRYSHLKTIDPAIRIGARVKMGQLIGLLGKEGGSGGWSHLHFEVGSRQPSGRWGTEEGYAFLWQSYVAEHKPDVIAVARPHHLAATGEEVTLDGSRSWARAGGTLSYDWTFWDGTTGTGARPTRRYSRPGMYSEILKVTDGAGRVAYDFAVVQVIDPAEPQALPPSIQAVYAPSLSVKAGEPVTFKVRTFRTQDGEEVWDFGDGTEPVTVKSDGNVKIHNPDGFAVTEHAFAKRGDYIVSVRRTNARGFTATAHLWISVE